MRSIGKSSLFSLALAALFLSSPTIAGVNTTFDDDLSVLHYDLYGDDALDEMVDLDDFGYGADWIGDDKEVDSNNYYGDDGLAYYESYGSFADEYGLDYFDIGTTIKDCTEDEAGKANVRGASERRAGGWRRKYAAIIIV
jgi:hypothetical protein